MERMAVFTWKSRYFITSKYIKKEQPDPGAGVGISQGEGANFQKKIENFVDLFLSDVSLPNARITLSTVFNTHALKLTLGQSKIYLFIGVEILK